MKTKNFIFLFFVVLILPTIFSCRKIPNTFVVMDAWARPGLEDGNSAVFLEIQNYSGSDDNLDRVTSGIAKAVEIHRTKMIDGVMKMEKQTTVGIPNGAVTYFEPGGLHIMLINLNNDLSVGDEFQVILEFKEAGEIIINVPVHEP